MGHEVAAEGSFPEDVVAAVLAHMNDDHADDSLLICRMLGERPDATAAVMTGFDHEAAMFEATVPGGVVPIRIGWGRPVRDRGDVRVAVVAMFRAAQERSGTAPS
ncbi:DUF2470 domain-containing protein [Gordonia sp. zg691]|uniref:DUF2470 domain-containing protein n=1 Tax=Gordonia jinghuaiqii TaxID=2758710 RepID=A0A7D7LUZ5_9ACTN|nr:DUF2470 domain-containing protein [Gordonia jinghuaiqii]MBD0863638.1 DUF2470 domain-containing protein [Gordonia jinghuaiqii]MCR5979373.1 DUF2470 domain-containing protein [Gordonia jinghuaiqii]QMT01155.1 DUF2470 domain-containing protein [Gordonia jinghuaiqii]